MIFMLGFFLSDFPVFVRFLPPSPPPQKLTETALASLETYHDEVRNAFAATLDWLNQW